jgi:hypothetical protein
MFRVIVAEVKEVEKLEKEWQKLKDNDVLGGEPEYGYVQTKNMVEEVNQVYTQEVEDIDLVAVIDAVNKKQVKEKK